jgi:AraC-like DNA-binding protein
MTGFQSSLYTAAIALCVFSAGILRDKQARVGRPLAWFTTFLCVATLGFVFELLMIHPAAPFKALWLGLRMGTSLLIAPCLWLAVRESVEGVRPRLGGLGRDHGLAILAGFLLLVPLIISAHSGTGFTKPPGADRPLHFVIHETMLLCIGIFAVQVPYYVWQCRRILLAANGSSKWLQFPLLVVLTTWVVGLLRTLQCIAHAPQQLNLLFAVADVGMTVGAIYLIVRREPVDVPEPEALAPEGSCAPETPFQIETPCAPETKYARSCLDAATSKRIRRKLETALASPDVCGDSLLNLRSLSRAISEKAHYVSQVINRDLNSNFFELVNRHRIAQAKKLLAEESGKTILEIAMAVGFNSKSTFNTAFRRHAGMTPSAFRAGSNRESEG